MLGWWWSADCGKSVKVYGAIAGLALFSGVVAPMADLAKRGRDEEAMNKSWKILCLVLVMLGMGSVFVGMASAVKPPFDFGKSVKLVDGSHSISFCEVDKNSGKMYIGTGASAFPISDEGASAVGLIGDKVYIPQDGIYKITVKASFAVSAFATEQAFADFYPDTIYSAGDLNPNVDEYVKINGIKIEKVGGDNAPPVAKFTPTSKDVYVGQTTTFDASDSLDYDGSITEYQWEFEGADISWSAEKNTYRKMG